MVNPKGGAPVAFGRACAFRNFPQVSVGLTRSYGIVCFVLATRLVFIPSTLGVLFIEHPMWVNAVGSRGIVLKDYSNRVSDFGADEWAKNAQMLPRFHSWLKRSEGCVSVLAEDSFAVHGRVCIQHPFGVGNVLKVEFLTRDLVDA